MRVFVYGTLKRGFPLHHHLRGGRLLGGATTAARYALFQNQWYPCLVDLTDLHANSDTTSDVSTRPEAVTAADTIPANARPWPGGPPEAIVGEVYDLDDTTLDRVDRLETSAANEFLRRPVALATFTPAPSDSRSPGEETPTPGSDLGPVEAYFWIGPTDGLTRIGPCWTDRPMPTMDGAAIRYVLVPDLTVEAFIDVLRRSGLDARRPVDRPDQVARMLAGADVIVGAFDGPTLVGVARAITDFAYCTYLSDLAVDQAYQRQGIGRRLIDQVHEASGRQTRLILLAAPDAVRYYGHIGMEPHPSCWMVPPGDGILDAS